MKKIFSLICVASLAFAASAQVETTLTFSATSSTTSNATAKGLEMVVDGFDDAATIAQADAVFGTAEQNKTYSYCVALTKKTSDARTIDITIPEGGDGTLYIAASSDVEGQTITLGETETTLSLTTDEVKTIAAFTVAAGKYSLTLGKSGGANIYALGLNQTLDAQHGLDPAIIEAIESRAMAPANILGLGHQYELGPDMLAQYTKTSVVTSNGDTLKTVEGADSTKVENKWGINTNLTWIDYVNESSTLDNGNPEVQTSARGTNIDPVTGNKGTWMSVSGAAGTNSPVVGTAKALQFYVKEASSVVFFGVGSASGSAADNNCMSIKAIPSDNTESIDVTSTPGAIYGKGTASDSYRLFLDPSKKYLIEVKAAVKDIMISGIQLVGTYTVPANTTGYNYVNIITPDLIVKKDKSVASTTAEGADTIVIQQKNAINSQAYPWVVYTNATSYVDDGYSEVSTANGRWTYIDPVTCDSNYVDGVATYTRATGVNGSNDAIVLGAKTDTWPAKVLTLYLKDTKKIRVLGVGSSSGSAADENCIDVTATSNDGEVVTFNSTPGAIYGKGGVGCEVFEFELDPEKSWAVAFQARVKDIELASIAIWTKVQTTAPEFYEVDTLATSYINVNPADYIIAKTSEVEGAADVNAIDDTKAPWLVYNNNYGEGNHAADGSAAVQTNNRWTMLNPETLDNSTAMQVANVNGETNKQVVLNLGTGGNAGLSKTLDVYVKNAARMRVIATGQGGSIGNGNQLVIAAAATDGSELCTAKSVAGTIAGKSKQGDDYVSIDLNPEKSYIVNLSNSVSDIQISGIHFLNAEAAAAEDKSLNAQIKLGIAHTTAATLSAGLSSSTITLAKNGEYELAGEAPVGKNAITLAGNNAVVKTTADGQITTQNSLNLSAINFDCSASEVAPIAMAAVPDSASQASWKVYTDVSGADSIAYTYEGASQKVFFADNITVSDCNFAKLGTSLVAGGKQPWALGELNIQKVIAEFTYTSGDPIINWYGGPNSIKNIAIKQSTLYADSANTSMYFLRYSNASNAQPNKVWGTDASASWTMQENTIVNLPSAQNFANNYVSKNNDTLRWDHNVFVNTWRLQKAVGNCVFVSDSTNCIMGGVNAVDATDAAKYAVEVADMGIRYDEAPELDFADQSNLKAAFSPYESCYATKCQAGDPRWLSEYVAPATAIELDVTATVSVSEPNTWGDSFYVVTLSYAVPEGTVETMTAEGILVDGSIYNFQQGAVTITDGVASVLCTDSMVAVTTDSSYEGEVRAEGVYPMSAHIVCYDAEGNESYYDWSADVELGLPVGIETLSTEKAGARIYDLQGRQVKAANGFVIINGAKAYNK